MTVSSARNFEDHFRGNFSSEAHRRMSNDITNDRYEVTEELRVGRTLWKRWYFFQGCPHSNSESNGDVHRSSIPVHDVSRRVTHAHRLVHHALDAHLIVASSSVSAIVHLISICVVLARSRTFSFATIPSERISTRSMPPFDSSFTMVRSALGRW